MPKGVDCKYFMKIEALFFGFHETCSYNTYTERDQITGEWYIKGLKKCDELRIEGQNCENYVRLWWKFWR